MTRDQFRQKWETRRDEWSRLGASMPVGPLLSELLAELQEVDQEEGNELLNLTQAAIRSGYTPDSLRRMIRGGRLTDFGKKHAPRVRARDLPRRPLRTESPQLHTRDASRQSARVSSTLSRGAG